MKIKNQLLRWMCGVHVHRFFVPAEGATLAGGVTDAGAQHAAADAGVPAQTTGVGADAAVNGEASSLDGSALSRALARRRGSREGAEVRQVADAGTDTPTVDDEPESGAAPDAAGPQGLPGTDVDEDEGAIDTDVDAEADEQPEAYSDEAGAEDEPGEWEALDPGLERIQDLPSAVRTQVEGIIERFKGKHVAKLKAAEESLADVREQALAREEQARRAEAELVKVKAEGVTPPRTADQPLADYMDAGQLQQLEDTSWDLLAWLRANPSGGEYRWGTGERNAIQIKEDSVPVEITRLERELQQQIPQRRQWLAQRDQASVKAREEFPMLAKPEHPFTQDVNAIIASFPEIKKLPSYEYVAAWAALGRSYSALYGGGSLVEDMLKRIEAQRAKQGGDAQGKQPAGKPAEGGKAPAGTPQRNGATAAPQRRRVDDVPPRASVPGKRPTAGATRQRGVDVSPEQRGKLTQEQMRERLRGRFA